MRVLVVGSGAREHALVRALQNDDAISQVVAAPGNPGIAAEVVTHPVDIADPSAITELAQREQIDLVVIGPEQPLVDGAADRLSAANIACFGPSAAAARLEGSKAFAKEVMAAAGVPTAESRLCTDQAEAEAALDSFGPPYVVKNDGLAGGKGVIVTRDRVIALEHAESCIADGHDVVIEEFLEGPEVSLFVITDGEVAVPLLPAQDFKRAGDGGTGPNTGGMGAYAPLPWAETDLVEQIMTRVAQPTIAEMARRGTPYRGVLYCGLALTSRGPRVVEFNCRFGDPEIQAVLRLLRSPLGQVLAAAADGRLGEAPSLAWAPDSAVCVVLAAEGYPGPVMTGDAIMGVPDAEGVPGVQVFHAATRLNDDGILEASGGRVLSVTGAASDQDEARRLAYEGMRQIHLRGSHYRTDIAVG